MRAAWFCALGAALPVALACRGGEEDKAEPPAPVETSGPPPALPAEPAIARIVPEVLPPETAEAGLLERAYPAWGAVLDRAALLFRRGERGAVYGRVAAVAGGTWLLDESPTAAGLGIRIAGKRGTRLEIAPGQRILAFGAWEADGPRWVWRVERLVALRDTGSAAPPAPVGEPLPGALVRTGAAGEGARTFWVVAAPVKAGDGWTIADARDGPPVATLLLPGEMLGAPYGGLDYLAAEERWTLARGRPYAAPLSEVQLRRKLPLPVLRATAPPVAVAPP